MHNKMVRPWLSVLIPVYNVSPYLAECIASIVAQADNEIEIIMLDDVSTDDSCAVAHRLADQHAPMARLVQHPRNAGVSAARNTLIDESSGDYLWFVDADDRLLPGAIARLRAIVSAHAPDLVSCDYRRGGWSPRWSFRGPARRLSHDRDQLLAGTFRARKMYSWLRIARRELWGDDLRFPAFNIFEDAATTPRLLLRARSWYHEPRAWIDYRVRPGSAMASITRARGSFDFAKHDQIAVALAPFKAELAAMAGGGSDAVRFWVSHFILCEYRKLIRRIDAADCGAEGRAAKLRYHQQMQDCAPMPFAQVEQEYLRRGKFYGWWQARRVGRQIARLGNHAAATSAFVQA